MGEATSQRTCAGCRQHDTRDGLLRFALAGDPPGLVPDIRRRLPGRGVSVHPRFECLRRAVHGGAFKRAFRRDVAADASSLADQARGQYERRFEGLLVAAGRGGHVALGTEAVRDAIREHRAQLLLVAEDSAGRRDEILRSAERLADRCLVTGSKQRWGRLFGRPTLGVLAVLDRPVADEMNFAARCAANLAEAS